MVSPRAAGNADAGWRGVKLVARRPLLGGILPAIVAGLAGLQTSRAAAQDPPASPPATPIPPRPGKSIWRSFYLGTRVWGYADKHSVDAGEAFNLMLSTGPDRASVRGTIEIYRIGHHPEQPVPDRKLVWRSPGVTVSQQPVEITAAAIGAGWPAGLEDIATDGWRSGYYALDFVDDIDANRDRNVASIVVTNKARHDTAKRGDILLLLSTNTWQAYNEWGGYSFYSSDFIGSAAQALTFDRPTPPEFFEYEYFTCLWLEKLASERGWSVDYATNFDIHRDPAFTETYRLLISGSHNEYWSLAEFKAMHRRIFDLGRNTMFLGADAAYWQIRYADVNQGSDPQTRGRQLICFKSADDPNFWRPSPTPKDAQITTLFREDGRWPETMLTGVAYQGWFGQDRDPLPAYPYYAVNTDFAFFAGTGYRPGDPIGDLAGYEWDNRDPEGDGRRLWSATASHIPAIDPAAIQVLFQGKTVDVDGRPGLAEAVYFRSPAGGKVFTAGSIRWAWGLGKPGFAQAPFQLFNAQLVADFLREN